MALDLSIRLFPTGLPRFRWDRKMVDRKMKCGIFLSHIFLSHIFLSKKQSEYHWAHSAPLACG